MRQTYLELGELDLASVDVREEEGESLRSFVLELDDINTGLTLSHTAK